MTVSVIDPRLMGMVRSSGYLPTVGTIEERAGTQSDSGEEAYTWTPVAGLEAIQLAFSPTIPSTVTRTTDMSRDIDTQYALLDGYYPQISTANRLVIDDEPWTILMVDFDSQRVLTALKVEQVAS